jgi:hypothetical protein
MNKLDFHRPSDNVELPSEPSTFYHLPLNTSPEAARRLIVLVPADSDRTAMLHRVWKLASASGMRVLFLSLCQDEAQEPTLHRELITMSALIQDGSICAEAKVEIGTNWVDVVKRNYQAGDMIVCFAGQRAGILRKPLSQVLEANLEAPIYLLSGAHPQNPSTSTWLSQVMVWAGSIGIIVGSAFLQIRITSLQQDWAQTTLMILSVLGEIWLIWSWNSLFN